MPANKNLIRKLEAQGFSSKIIDIEVLRSMRKYRKNKSKGGFTEMSEDKYIDINLQNMLEKYLKK